MKAFTMRQARSAWRGRGRSIYDFRSFRAWARWHFLASDCTGKLARIVAAAGA